MKTKYQILSGIASLFIAGAMSSCSEDYATGIAPGTDAVRIASATVGTQASAATNTTEFADGEAFSLSTLADGNGAATYTLNGNNWSSTTPLYWSNDETSDFYAAYPVGATYNSFNLPTDQSNGTKAANYMTAKQENAKRKTPLGLTFSHKTAMVIIKIIERALGNEGNLDKAVIRSPHSGYTEAAVTGGAINVTPTTTTAAETDVEACYTALVIPGEATGFKLFSVKVDDKEVSFTTDIDFEANHVYEYTLTIGKDRLALNNFSVSDSWTPSAFTGTMDKEWDGEKANDFAGGTGTEDDPFQIANAAQLLHLALDVKNFDSQNYYKLTRDIDLARANWTPIGYKDNYVFNGHFDGGGHSIKNMKINQSEVADIFTSSCVGFFWKIGDLGNDVSIRNLTIEDAQITVTSGKNLLFIGILAGEVNLDSHNCIIDNCHIKNAKISVVYESDATWRAWVGGIVGQTYTNTANVSFSRCTVEGLSATGNGGTKYFGGICGATGKIRGKTQILACSVTGTMQGNYTCGLAGSLWGGNGLEVSGSYADCTLTGSNKAACVAHATSDFSSTMSLSYFAGRGANGLYTYDESNPKATASECHIFTNPSTVYGIVANPNNTTTFTVDNTEYKVWECWQDNGNALPTLKEVKAGN